MTPQRGGRGHDTAERDHGTSHKEETRCTEGRTCWEDGFIWTGRWDFDNDNYYYNQKGWGAEASHKYQVHRDANGACHERMRSPHRRDNEFKGGSRHSTKERRVTHSCMCIITTELPCNT